MPIATMAASGKHHHYPETIIRAAINTTGESMDFVLGRTARAMRVKSINLMQPSLRERHTLCRFLYLDPNCIFDGYDKREPRLLIRRSLCADASAHEIATNFVDINHPRPTMPSP